jgi:hypothetical protein
MRNIGVVLFLVCVASFSLATYFFVEASGLKKEVVAKAAALQEAERRVNLPIGLEEAIGIAKEDPEFLEFSNQYFKDPELRVELASLQLHETLGYTWKVELIERKCGCGGRTSLNSMDIYVDPETGEVLLREKNIGVSEDELARKNCEKGCHV